MGLKERESVYYMLLYKYLAENKHRVRGASRTNILYNCHSKALQMANYILAALDMSLDDSEVAIL